MIASFLQGLESFFAWLLQASWQASVLVALVLLAQAVLRHRLNPRWHHALWLLVILRLLMPVLPESALSIFQFTPAPPASIVHSVTRPFIAQAEWPPSRPIADSPPLPQATPRAPAYPFSLYTLIALIWLAGALALLLATWLVNLRFARQIESSPAVNDAGLLAIASAARAEIGLRCPLRLIESSKVGTPAVMGLFRPTLLLPIGVRGRFSDAELRFIFLHEFAHLKRGDLTIQWLIALLQILHWFNPVLWLAFRRMRADREPATDALVLSRTSETEPYGRVLIKVLEHYHRRNSLPTLVGILEDKNQLKRRFDLIARFTAGAYRWSFLGVFLIALLSAICLTASSRTAVKRDPALPHVIDLTPYYSKIFKDPAGSDSSFAGYAGRKRIDGLPFDIGGEVRLAGEENTEHGDTYPADVPGITIGRKFDELHLIHVAQWREYPGCQIATIRLHYADGSQYDFPIQYGYQVSDWNRLYSEDTEIVTDPATKIIWRGKGVFEGKGRIFKSVLINPHPEELVETMEIISLNTSASYVLVAATVAQKDRHRVVTPPMPLMPGRNFDGVAKVRVKDGKTGAPIAGAVVYPVIGIKTFNLVADKVLTGADGAATVKYPKETTKFLTLAISAAGYLPFNENIEFSWNVADIPEGITYKLAPQAGTGSGDQVSTFEVTPPAHPNLITAVRQGDAVSVQKLIDQGADISKVEVDGSPLIFAASSPEVADVLLAHGVNPNALNKEKVPALNYFCRRFRSAEPSEFARVLLAHGADPNSREPNDLTPLMETDDARTVELLVAHGADVKVKTPLGASILSMATQKSPGYVDGLIRAGVPFDVKTDGPTLMARASWVNNTALMQDLLARGVDPNLAGVMSVNNGKTDMMKPMEAAVIDGQFDAAKLLLDHGAKADDCMENALYNRQYKIVKLFWDHGVRNISELTYAVSQNAPLTRLQGLLDKGDSVLAPTPNSTGPLDVAAQMGRLDAFRLLFKSLTASGSGSDITARYLCGSRALSMAASEGQYEIVAFLLSHGVKADGAALAVAANNSTPYDDQRPASDFEKTIHLLIDAGGIKNATPEERGSILYCAFGTRHGPPNTAVIKMLIGAGISPESPMPPAIDAEGKLSGNKTSVIDAVRELRNERPGYAASYRGVIDLLEAADKHPASSTGTGN
jgi:beta-lactamase regulating signal transducer with metallopeptidase domain/ankyrin repeat protein